MKKIVGTLLVLTTWSFAAKAEGLIVYELDQQPAFTQSFHEEQPQFKKNPSLEGTHKKSKLLSKFRQALKEPTFKGSPLKKHAKLRGHKRRGQKHIEQT